MDKLAVSLLSTFTVALLHTLIPSHWLCFVVVGRAQGWRTRKTLAVAAAAGTLHVASTVGLGVAVVAFGKAFLDPESPVLEKGGAAILIALGLLYLASHVLHAGHRHAHDQSVTEKTAFAALVLSLVFSPCSAAIPFLVAASHTLGTGAVMLLSAVLLATTLGVMMLLIGLTTLGIEKLQFSFFDRYEKLILGLVLAALGGLSLAVH
ncbi:MAG TPA: hypothetical protein VNO22_09920 [Planctomycetota bacterium]|nr:hypothetical protein [Planctomycetota bacterium]